MKNSIFFFTIVALVLSSCIGEDFIDDGVSMKERLSIVTAAVGNDTLTVGDTLQYQAKFYDISGDEVPRALIWSSSKPEVASIDSLGRVIALTKGVANISVNAGGLQDDKLLIVQQLERVEINTSISSLFVGDSTTLSASYFNKMGLELSANINWQTSDPVIASIDNLGKLKALSRGATSVTATANGISSDAFVMTIVADSNAVASVTISSDTSQIQLNETLQFNAVAKNINGNVLAGQNVQWNSSDPTILAVNNNGLASPISVGSASISATISGVMSNSIAVLVSQAMLSSRTGSLSGRSGYNVSGTVSMDLQANGSLKLNFSNFSSQNGPGLYIYLSNNTSGGVDVGKLPQLSGNFSVNLPANISIDDYNYVLIWCKPFGVTFGAALLN